jgi:putative PIN family toxin of toxin-antitoxin system
VKIFRRVVNIFGRRRVETRPCRIVVDTNIMVGAIMKPTGASNKILDMWIQGRLTLLVTERILDEYRTILSQKWLKPDRVRELSRHMSEFAEVVDPKERVYEIKDDPSDNRFLECAAEGEADYIISSDQHLLALKRFRRTEIVRPTQFLKRVEP